MIQYSAPFSLAKETWKIIKNLSIADQPEKKNYCNNCYDITIIIVDHLLNTKTKKKFKIVYSTY